MKKFAYEDLSPEQFEELIVSICQFLLGTSVQGFCKGPDGGRDAKFTGTANEIPSKMAPWIGTTIVQAKHTNSPVATFSDSEFSSEASKASVVSKEIPRIKALKDTGELNHYILFANRRLSGNADKKIKARISTECGVPIGSILLFGAHQIDLFLKRFPAAAELADFNPLDSPLNVGPDELAEIIEAISVHIPNASTVLTDPPTDRVSYEEKNKINNLSPEYASHFLKRYLKETQVVKEFLANPENTQLLEKYLTTVDEFQRNIIPKRKDYNSFDELLNYLFNFLFARDPVLNANKRETKLLVFYMYWNCDLGRNPDDPTD